VAQKDRFPNQNSNTVHEEHKTARKMTTVPNQGEVQRGVGGLANAGRTPSSSSLGSGASASHTNIPRETQGRRALSYSIRHHAAILQHKSADGQALEIQDPTEILAPRPVLHPVAQRAPPLVADGGESYYIKPVPMSRMCFNRRCTLALAAFALVGLVSFGLVFGITNLDYGAGMMDTFSSRLNSLAVLGETSQFLVSGIIRLPDAIENNIRNIVYDGTPGVQAGTPFFLQVPHNGGKTLERLTQSCLKLTEASGLGRGSLQRQVRMTYSTEEKGRC
jgi:hypothetical protein